MCLIKTNRTHTPYAIWLRNDAPLTTSVCNTLANEHTEKDCCYLYGNEHIPRLKAYCHLFIQYAIQMNFVLNMLETFKYHFTSCLKQNRHLFMSCANKDVF